MSTRRIAVTVRSPVDKSVLFADSTTVHVTPRSWSFRRMTHSGSTYAVPDSASPWGWGAFATFINEPQRPSTREGSGPWEGEYYWSGPYQLRGQIYLHTDFDTTGTAHAGADSTCGGVPAWANVRLVNDTCGYGTNLNMWDGMVRTHELRHENGANNCLLGGTAAVTALADMEKVTGSDRGTVVRRFNEIFQFRYSRMGLWTRRVRPRPRLPCPR